MKPEEKKFFHELTDEEYQVLLDKNLTWNYVIENHPPPSWCNYPGPLEGRMGCWSLVLRYIKSKADCINCELASWNRKE